MTGYVHGYDDRETLRLVRQAEILSPWTMDGVHFPARSRVVEVGCGVGAELRLLARRQPDVRWMGCDLVASQLTAARLQLDRDGLQVPLVQADGTCLPFPDASVDGVFTCWLLEHVPDPVKLLTECRRVMRAGSVLYAREVENSSFRIWPECADVDRYIDALNRAQSAWGGDPFVGRRLFALLIEAGFDTATMELPAIHADAGMGEAWTTLVSYFHDLLAGVRPSVIAAGLDSATADRALTHLRELVHSPMGSIVHQPRFARASVHGRDPGEFPATQASPRPRLA